MCRNCGCSDQAQPKLTNLQTGRSESLEVPHLHHAQGSDAPPAHAHGGWDSDTLQLAPTTKTIRLEQNLLAKNDALAERNRSLLKQHSITAVNLISSPGAGKTTLLVRTIQDLGHELPFQVIEGDQATLNDARRIQAAGCQVVQINTGAGCHLEADMTARGLEQLAPPPHSLVFIENVGNLVCPALFDLGENAKVVVASVTEGDDKPLKYPHAFRSAKVVVLNKIDLLPYVEFDSDQFLAHVQQINPKLRVFQVSATRGDGLADWYAWLRAARVKPVLV